MSDLMAGNKKVIGLALGDNEFFIFGFSNFTMSFATRTPNTSQWVSDFSLVEAGRIVKFYMIIDGTQTQMFTGNPLASTQFDNYSWGSDGKNFYVDNGSRDSPPSVTIYYYK